MLLVMLHDLCVAYVATEIEWQYPSGNIFPEKENIIKVHLFIKQLFVRSSLDTIWWFFQLIFKLTSAGISWMYPQTLIKLHLNSTLDIQINNPIRLKVSYNTVLKIKWMDFRGLVFFAPNFPIFLHFDLCTVKILLHKLRKNRPLCSEVSGKVHYGFHWNKLTSF